MRMEAGAPVSSISPEALFHRLYSAAAPLVVDVRRAPDFEGDEWMIAGAVRRPPETVESWGRALPPGRPVVVYCVAGHEVSQEVAAALAASGTEAAFIEGGITGWRQRGLPCRRKLAVSGRWVTRARPKVDRIACPWLLRRFVDPEAEIRYVPAERVLATATAEDAVPFDVPNVEFGHVGERCSFDAFLDRFGLAGADPALDRLARIVRGADTGHPELTPQSPGLLAISAGLSATHPDDHAMLATGMLLYDALYAWCRIEASRGTP
jgi:rhodanese-related sulfurtransferase